MIIKQQNTYGTNIINDNQIVSALTLISEIIEENISLFKNETIDKLDSLVKILDKLRRRNENVN